MPRNTQYSALISEDALNTWRSAVIDLTVQEILQLCYGLYDSEERFWLYLDELRRRSSRQALLASCILCYDLARRKNPRARREFAYLAGTMRDLARDKTLTDNVIGEDPYLLEIWNLVRAHLINWDPRVPAEALEPTTVKVGFLPLLSDADFLDHGFQQNLEEQQNDGNRRLQNALNIFLGCDPSIPFMDPNAGFKLQTSADIERVEEFVRELTTLERIVPLARGFKALILLFYATHLRSKNIFGSINERKEELMRQGLDAFIRYGHDFWDVVGVLEPLHENPGVWNKIADLLLDYCDWLSTNESSEEALSYTAVERLLERQLGEENRRVSTRS